MLIGADARRIDRRVQPLVPGYMTMGHDGMGAMSEMGMKLPANSIAMQGAEGPFASIDMGGMFTVLKVRANPEQEDGSGWYRHPAGTVAEVATIERLTADGIDPERMS